MFCLFSVPSRNSTSLYRSLSFLFPVSEVASEEVEEVKGVEEKVVDVGGGSGEREEGEGERMKGRKRKTEKGEGAGKRKKIKGTENEEEEEEKEGEKEVECEENEGQTSEDVKSRKELDKLLGRGNGLVSRS